MLNYGKNKESKWTCYNGVMVEIGNVKFINFTKIAWISCTKLDKYIRIIENYIRTWGSGAERPDGSQFLWIFPKFSSCNFNFFLKFEGRPPRQKIIIKYFPDKWVRGAKPSELQRKFKIFPEKSQDFYEILKEFKGKW